MCLFELTDSCRKRSFMERSVVSASRVYITLTLSLPLLSQLWQRGLYQCPAYSIFRCLGRTLVTPKAHGQLSKQGKFLKSFLELYEHWWNPSKSQWYMKTTRFPYDLVCFFHFFSSSSCLVTFSEILFIWFVARSYTRKDKRSAPCSWCRRPVCLAYLRPGLEVSWHVGWGRREERESCMHISIS